MEQSSLWEANRCSTDHEFPHLFMYVLIEGLLTQLSVAQTIWRRMLQRLMDSDLERMRKEVFVAAFEALSRSLPGGPQVSH
jgi:hypothetical protein